MLNRVWNALRRLRAHPAPPDPDLLLDKVVQCIAHGALDDARKHAAAFACHRAYAAYAQALICEAAGEIAAALGHAAAAMQAAPAEPVYWLKRAQLHHAAGQYADAAALYDRLVDLADAPFAADPDILFACAAAHEQSGAAASAIGLLERLLHLHPDHTPARTNLAMLLALSARGERARAHMNVLVEREGSAAQRLRRALMLPAIHESAAHIAAVRARFTRDLDEVLEMPVANLAEPAVEIGLAPFMLAYQGHDNTALLAKFARAVRRHYPAAGRSPGPARTPAQRIRVGFVSRHFYAHSVARTTHGLIHDLPRDRFEVAVFGIEMRDDPWSRTIRGSADTCVALPADPARIRAAIIQAQLDVLIFADIGMEPFTYYLAFWRLAPVQMTTWGHPVTSGIDSVDYYISAASLEADDPDRRYTEQLIRLPGFFMPRYRRPALAEPRRSRPDALLDPARTTYFCAQTTFKLHPDFDAALLAILAGDPRAEILLMASTPEMGLQARRRLDRTLGKERGRVRFLPPLEIERFLRMQADADVLLDPFHFGGCNSTCEALGLAAPVVTLPGPYLAGRFTRASYAELGIEACVADSPARYAEIAMRLGTDRAWREEISAQIGASQPRLFGRPDAGLALGDAIEAIVREPGRAGAT